MRHVQKHHRKRLERREVEKLINKYKSGQSIAQLARAYGYHGDTVRRVLSGKNKHSMELLGGESIIVPQFALSEEVQVEIEKAMTEGASANALSKRYGVAIQTIKTSCQRVRVARGESGVVERVLKDMNTFAPLKIGPRRETIFTWAKKWEADYVARTIERVK